ncbi:MAG: hypothetical protein P4L49_02745 [Desulfosporosinus sp.]|nr:hypothetical protein [Desulfosporosinus sp.]
MKIIKLQAENVKKLKAIEIIPEGNVIKISGANEQGKTTVLDSIWWALAGTKGIQEQPIRTGEKKANVVVNLGDMIVTRKFTASGSTLEVKNPQGLKYPRPQDMLDKLIGKFSFDPLAFAKAGKKTQVDTLLGIVNICVDTDKLGSLAGVTVKDGANPLDTINNVHNDVFEARTAINRDRDKAKANYEGKTEAVETKPVSILELVSEKDKLQSENEKNDKQWELLENKLKEANEMEMAIGNSGNEIIRLREELEQKELQHSADIQALDIFKADLDSFFNEVNTLKNNDLTDINTRILNADETNRKAQEWVQFLAIQTEFNDLQKESEDYTSRLTAIKDYKDELIKAAKFPIDGLDFGGGSVLYQGLPFEQASSAQKLQVSLAIAMALNPELRVIRIDDGSLLDKAHMDVIEKMATENDFQIWMEVVDESGMVGIHIEDGEVK